MTPDKETIELVLRAAQLGVDASQQGWRVEFLERLRDIFEEQAHPLTPWFAMRWARRHNLPQPHWVLDYFCAAGERLNDAIHSSRSKNEAEAVGRALGFYSDGKGKSSPGAAAARDSQEGSLALQFELERALAIEQGRPFKAEAAIAAVVAKNHVSASKVRRAVERHSGTALFQMAMIQSLLQE